MRRIRSFLIGAFLGSVVFGASARGGITDPRTEWKVLRTAHFDVIYEASQLQIARQYAVSAERAYALLKPYFSEIPERTSLVVRDTTDLANGFASFLPYPMITVFPVLPESLSTLDTYGVWSDILVYHEFAHIVSFEPAHGFYTPLKYLFGTIVTPTALLPRWYLEGLAVEFETRLTKFGRLRSPSTNAAIRALVEGNALAEESIDRINESAIPTWPYGQRPYLFGSMMWNEIMRQGGERIADDLLQSYGRRLPFLINGPAEEKLFEDYAQILGQMYEDYATRAREQIQRIRAAGQPDYQPLKHAGTQQTAVSISPDGKSLIYVSADAQTGNGEIRRIQRDPAARESFLGKPFEMIRPTRGTLRLSWFPDSRRFVFDQATVHRRFYLFRDLYVYDLEAKSVERLTEGQRAWEPTVSPDGQKVAFIRHRPGGTELAVLDVSTKKIDTLYRPKLQVRLATPNFVSESALVLVGRELNGRERLYLFDLGSRKLKAILPSLKFSTQPKFTPGGLVFVSAHTGVPNLYLADANFASTRPLTNSTTRIGGGEIDVVTGEVFVSQLTHEGYKLFAAKEPQVADTPRMASLIPGGWPEPAKIAIPQKVESREYSSWRYMLPRYWIPFVFSTDGGFLMQGVTSATDPLGYNTYAIDAQYDTLTERVSYGVQYINGATSVDYELLFAERNEPLTSDGQITLSSRIAAAGGGFFLTSTPRWRATVSGLYTETDSPTASGGQITFKRAGPTAGLVITPFDQVNPAETGDLNLDTLQISLLHSHFLEQDDFVSYDRSFFSFSYLTRRFLPSQHAFLMDLKGAVSPEQPQGTLVVFGERTMGGRNLANLINSAFLMRGYPAGNFIGRNILNANIEYQFPLGQVQSGRGTFPLFLRRLDLGIFADAVAVDGVHINRDGGVTPVSTGQGFFSAGLELKAATTTAYHFPLTFILGLYYGFDSEARGGFTPFLGIGLDGHRGVSGTPSGHRTQRPF